MTYFYQELYAGGWEIIISSDLSRVRDLSTFFLKRPAIPIKDAANIHIFTITLSGENLLYLTNIPKSTKHELVKILNENWGKGVKKVITNPFSLIVLFKFRSACDNGFIFA
jgi:hypothetical protein